MLPPNPTTFSPDCHHSCLLPQPRTRCLEVGRPLGPKFSFHKCGNSGHRRDVNLIQGHASHERKIQYQKQAVWPWIRYPEYSSIQMSRHQAYKALQPDGYSGAREGNWVLILPLNSSLGRKLYIEGKDPLPLLWDGTVMRTQMTPFSAHFDKENKTCLVQRIRLLSLYNLLFDTVCNISCFGSQKGYCSVWGDKGCEIRVGRECGITKS